MRTHQIELAAINIAVHPHRDGAQTYVDFWNSAFELERPIKVHGSTYAMIGSANHIAEDRPEEGIEGDIFRFIQIDLDSDFLDMRTRKPMDPAAAQREVVFPDYIKPNLERVPYVFFPKSHRLIFCSYDRGVSLSPRLAEKMLLGLLSDREFARAFPSVDVTIEQSTDVLDVILNEMQLDILKIVIKRPNPDSPDEDDASIEAVLDEQNAREQLVELKSADHQHLKPNAYNRKLAETATSNGSVYGKGLDKSGKKVEENTAEHPRTLTFEHADRPPLRDAVREKALEFLKAITRRKK